MVVVRRPALPEQWVRAATVALVEEGLVVNLRAFHCDPDVVHPLQPEVGADGVVERIAVEDIRETFHLRAGRVPRLILRLGGLGVELHVGIGAVAEVTGKALADHAARRLDAARLEVAHGLLERLAVDRLAEGVTGCPAAVDAGEQTRLDVEADPVRDSQGDQRQLLRQLGVGCVAGRLRRRQRLPPVADQAEQARLVLVDLRRRVGDDLDMDALEGPGLAAVPVSDRFEVHRLAGCARRHPKRPTADQGRGLVERRVFTHGRDHVAVDHPERP